TTRPSSRNIRGNGRGSPLVRGRGSAEDGRSMSTIASSDLSNKDLAPTGPERRTWGTYNLVALWIGLSIVITTYTLASGLIAAGMEWWQGLLTISLGNFIVLIPILLHSHPGTKYRIPFPVRARSTGSRSWSWCGRASAFAGPTWPRWRERWWRADGSGFRRGSARWRSTR